MKRYIFVLTLLLASNSAQAQSLSLLKGLHPRPQVSYFVAPADTGFTLDSTTQIITQGSPSSATLKAVQYLQTQLKLQFGYTVPVGPELSYNFGGDVIFIGEKNWPLMQQFKWNSASHPEGYTLDCRGSIAVLCGDDTSGTFNSVSTLVQLLKAANNHIPALHLNDWPDYPIRWVFSTHNMMVLSQVAAVEAIEDSMAAHKLNGLQQNDFKYSILDWFDTYYFSHVDSMRVHAGRDNVEVIPGVCSIGYSSGTLIHDPDIAEGIPTTSTYYIEGDTGRLITDSRMTLPNGGFENVSNGQFTGWGFYDGPKLSVFVDSQTVHSGRYSARCESFTAGNPSGNCRFNRLVTCSPFHSYHMSVWMNTQGFSGDMVQLLALGTKNGKTGSLTFTQYDVPATNGGWQQYHVVFNSLTYDSIYVYCGVWGGHTGTIWFDDFQIEDAGMVNMLRRTDELPRVSGPGGSCVEGRDYALLVDSIMEKGNGSYTWHAQPSFKLVSGSAIHNGDTVRVRFIRANPVLNAQNNDGSTMVCVSEDTLYSILHDQISRVNNLLKPNRFFMGHDEVRVMNWDTACAARHKTPGELLADNLRKCDSIVKVVKPTAERFVWSDMFDSLHNAHNNYYLVNGDLSGDWNMIPKDITIVNWNGGLMSQSLNFFAKHGFSQVTSPYYDVPNTNNIRAWRLAMDTIPNMRGSMYTTWANDYSFLTPFADYAWSAGPMIIHEPLPLGQKITDGEYVQVNANVFADPYDPTDVITKVTYIQYDKANGNDQVTNINMVPDTGHFYRCTNLTQGDPGTDVTYEIRATDKNGITRTTPRYLILHIASDGVQVNAPQEGISIYPNPTNDRIVVTIPNSIPRNASIQIVNSIGAVCGSPSALEEGHISIDTHALPAGAYNLILKTGAETITKPFVVVR